MQYTRNKVIDIMKAIGIIAVVSGHNFEPAFAFFPPFTYHMALFFFISGYLFEVRIGLSAKLKFFIKKTKNQLFLYFLFNLFFGLLTIYLRYFDIRLGDLINFDTFFISPFSRGDQYHLYLATWFILNLYVINIFAVIVLNKNQLLNKIIAIIFFFITLFALKVGRNFDNSIWTIFLIRSLFGFTLFNIGYQFKIYEAKIKKYLISPISLFALFAIVNILTTNFGNISYSIMTGNIGNDFVLIPLITSVFIILMIYIIAVYISSAISEKSFIYKIGKHSFSIMVWHLTIFWLVNLVLYKFGLIPFNSLSEVYFRYEVQQYWLLYQIPAVVLPVIIASKLESRIQKSKQDKKEEYINLKDKFSDLFIKAITVKNAIITNLNKKVILLLSTITIFGFFYWLNDINSWKYFFVGDDWSFYKFAESTFRSDFDKYIFSLKGVYEKNGVIASLYQSLTMIIFGQNNFGWRISNILLIFPISFFMYKWVKQTTNNKNTAIISVFLIAFSATWSNFFKIGYINPQATVFYLATLWLLSKLVYKPTKNLSIYIGISLGIGFYIYTGLLLPIIIFPYLLEFIGKYKKKSWKYLRLITLVYFFFTISGFYEIIFSKSHINNSSVLGGREFSGTWPIVNNVSNGFLQFFNYYDYIPNHYTNGLILDHISQVFLIIGLIYILISKKKSLYIILYTYITNVIVFGLVNPYTYLPITRNYILLIYGFVFTSIGLSYGIKILEKLNFNHIFRKIVLITLLIIIAINNIYLSNFEYFNKYGYTQQALVFREIENSPTDNVVLYTNPDFKNMFVQIPEILPAYNLENKKLTIESIYNFKCEDTYQSYYRITFAKDLNEGFKCYHQLKIITDHHIN